MEQKKFSAMIVRAFFSPGFVSVFVGYLARGIGSRD